MNRGPLKPFSPWKALTSGAVLAPLLATYLFVGTCGAGKDGVVVAFRGWGLNVTAAWCPAAPPPNRA